MDMEIVTFKHEKIPEYLKATVIPEMQPAEEADPVAAVEANMEDPAATAATAANAGGTAPAAATAAPTAETAAISEPTAAAPADTAAAGAAPAAVAASEVDQSGAADQGLNGVASKADSTQAHMSSRDPPSTGNGGGAAVSVGPPAHDAAAARDVSAVAQEGDGQAAAGSSAEPATAGGGLSGVQMDHASVPPPTRIDLPSGAAHNAAADAMRATSQQAASAVQRSAQAHPAELANAQGGGLSGGAALQAAQPASDGAHVRDGAPGSKENGFAPGAATAHGGAEVWALGGERDSVAPTAHSAADCVNARRAGENGQVHAKAQRATVGVAACVSASAHGGKASAHTSESPSKRPGAAHTGAPATSKRLKASNSPPAEGCSSLQ